MSTPRSVSAPDARRSTPTPASRPGLAPSARVPSAPVRPGRRPRSRPWRFAALLALALGAAFGPQAQSSTGRAQAPQGKQISIATLGPPGSQITRWLDAWNRELRRRTNQGVSLRIYAGGVQGDDAEVVRKIRSGRLDGATITSVGLAQIHRPALVFQMPGTYLTYEQLDAARTALGPEVDAGIERAGFHMLGWADIGQARLFSNAPVRRPSDLADKKVWARTDDLVLPALFEVVRTTAVPLSVPEVLGGLQTGRVDTFFSPPMVAIALQWSSRARTVTDIPMSIVIGGTVIGDRAFQRLSPEEQAILKETGAQFHLLGRRNSRAAEREALDAVVQRGVQLVTTTDADRNEWRRVGAQVRQRLAARIADAALVERAASFGAR
jgi:TRAP-type C4-dicarboxylate transport system substrate-binding protein